MCGRVQFAASCMNMCVWKCLLRPRIFGNTHYKGVVIAVVVVVVVVVVESL